MRTVVLVVCTWLAVLAARGAEGDVPIQVKNVKLTTAQWMVTNTSELAESGAARFESVDGMVYVVVELSLQATWQNGINQMRFESKQVNVTVGQQTYPMVGRMMSGLYYNGASNLYMYQSSSQTNTNVYLLSPVFRIPATATKASLHLGNRLIIDFNVPAPTNLVPDANQDMKVEIVSAKLLNAVNSESTYNNYRLKVNYTNPYGKVLEVKVKVTPLTGNLSETRFQLSTRLFALLLPSSVMVKPIGERTGSGYVSSSSSTTTYARSDGTFGTLAKTLYFAVPAGLTEFTVLVTGQPVAKGKVSP